MYYLGNRQDPRIAISGLCTDSERLLGPIQPRRAENGEIILDSAYGEALFEILADDELEGPEEVGLISNPSYNSYEVTCDGGVAPISLSLEFTAALLSTTHQVSR